MNLDHLCLNCMKEIPQVGGPCPFCGFSEAGMNLSAQHLAPRTLLKGQYLVGRVLGQGGFGITYVGIDINLEWKVAIKEYYPKGYANRDCRYSNTMQMTTMNQALVIEQQRLLEEARVLAQCDDLPGVVNVKDYFQENGTNYIVMEYLEGETLRQHMARNGGFLPVNTVLAMMEPLLKSLISLHEKGVLHKDISPDNIMITDKGKVKLIDFGSALRMDRNTNLTQTYKGNFSPIEQRTPGGVVGTYSDIYSLCATMYYAITGQTPDSSISRVQQDNLVSPAQMGMAIPPIVNAALMNGLAVQPDERTASAKDLYYFLYMYGNEMGNQTALTQQIGNQMTGQLVQKVQQEKKRSKGLGFLFAGIGVLFGVALVAFCIWFFGPWGKKESVSRNNDSVWNQEANNDYWNQNNNDYYWEDEGDSDWENDYEDDYSDDYGYLTDRANEMYMDLLNEGYDLYIDDDLNNMALDFVTLLANNYTNDITDWQGFYDDMSEYVNVTYDDEYYWLGIQDSDNTPTLDLLAAMFSDDLSMEVLEESSYVGIAVSEDIYGGYFYVIYLGL